MNDTSETLPSVVVGIDLGTTHCAVARTDLSAGEHPSVESIAIAQLTSAETLEERDLLPSFLYLAAPSEGLLPLPWDAERNFAVGEYARKR